MKSIVKKILFWGFAAIIPAAVVVGVTVPIILQLENALGQFVPGKRPFVSLANKARTQGINYVALGDSVTAGYEALLGKDYLSYADFYAHDLENAGYLHSYKNFGVSGALISDVHNQIDKNVTIIHALSNADLVTVTVGANDLLRFVRLFDAPVGMSIADFLGFSNVFNPNRGGLDPSGDPNDPFTPNQRWNFLSNSFIAANNMFKTNNFAGVISIQPGLIQQVYNLIQRDLVFLLRDLGAIAPHADVIVTSHAFPFINLPSSAINNVMPGTNINTIQGFQIFKNALSTATGYASFARFVNFDDIPEYNENNEPYLPQSHSSYWSTNTNTPGFRYRKMPNIADIHPSTFGASLIGNGLFHWFAKPLFDLPNPTVYFTSSVPPTTPPGSTPKPFERLDEGLYAKNHNNILGGDLFRKNQTRNLVAEAFDGLTVPADTPNPVETNNSTYTLKLNDNQIQGTLNGPYQPPDYSLGIILKGMFGTSIDWSNFSFSLSNLLSNLPNIFGILNSFPLTNFFDLTSIGINSAVGPEGETPTAPGLTAPKTFIQNQITSYKQFLFNKETMGQVKQTIIFYLNTGKNILSYNDKNQLWTQFATAGGTKMKNFGDLWQTYTTSRTYSTIRSIAEVASTLLFPHVFSGQQVGWPIAANNGTDFINQVKQMGENSLAQEIQKMLSTAETQAKGDKAHNQELHADAQSLVSFVKNINLAYNQVNHTDPNLFKNDLWIKLNSMFRGDLPSFIQKTVLPAIYKDHSVWAQMLKNLNIPESTTVTGVYGIFQNNYKFFSGVPTFSVSSILGDVQTAVVVNYHLDSIMKMLQTGWSALLNLVTPL